MKKNKELLIAQGNAFYELDLDCLEKKEQEKSPGQKGAEPGIIEENRNISES